MYQELVDSIWMERYEDRPPDGKLHPSSLSNCERQAVYNARGEAVTDPTEMRSIRIMGRGTQMHEEIQAQLLKKYPGTLLEVDVEWGPISGSADALVPVSDGRHYDESGNPEDGLQPVYELQEFKSISPTGKKFLYPKPHGKRGPGNAPKPKPEHVKQARIYYLFLEEQGYLLDGIRITYFDRDDYSTLELEVDPWDDHEAEEFLDNLATLEEHLVDGTLPPQMPDDFWLCRYCEYRTTCKG